MRSLALGSVLAVGVLALAVGAANTDWAIAVAALAVALVFGADRLTYWRNRP